MSQALLRLLLARIVLRRGLPVPMLSEQGRARRLAPGGHQARDRAERACLPPESAGKGPFKGLHLQEVKLLVELLRVLPKWSGLSGALQVCGMPEHGREAAAHRSRQEDQTQDWIVH